ncbi:MAG: flavodoxin [Coriobacteriales bacterium]|jgi:flavodoxin short chain|nr:flavodoxin [Coriobacteriales bacterium]
MATAIIYWSGTGNTEAMAQAIEEGLGSKGAEVEVFSVDEAPGDLLDNYERFAFGCPSMGDEVLEEDEFEPFFSKIEGGLAGKKVALFGSYGWGNGEWMDDWRARTEAAGALVFEEGLIQQEAPDAALCRSFGERFADF